MAKATTTIKQVLSYQPHHAQWFAANQLLYNRVVAFYFEAINAHEKILDLAAKDALTALEKLTHRTEKNPHPIMPLHEIAEDIPALFRRSAINAALGSARSFFSHLKTWHVHKEKAQAKGKKWNKRPPRPPRAWNKSVPFYLGQWKERELSSIMLKVWSGTCWEWVKLRLTGRALPHDQDAGSPSLIRHGNQWWLHTPIEKAFKSQGKVEKQVTTNEYTRICAIDLNLGENIAVCSIQTVEGTILATQFIGGGNEISGFRKRQLGRIARNRSKTVIIAEGEQDNVALWQKIQNKNANQEPEGYTIGACLVLYPTCKMRGNADRNASLVIGQRLVARYQKTQQEKPQTPLHAKRVVKATGDACSQVSQCEEEPSISLRSGDGTRIEHGTAQEETFTMDECSSRYSLPITDSVE